jgi:hypothetical protein
MNRTWVEELQVLAMRFNQYGIGPDLANLTVAEAWGVYIYLLRVARGALDG